VFTPGAIRSTVALVCEKEARTSESVVAPTARTPANPPGYEMALVPLFPAAATSVIPAATAVSMVGWK
jgi:hypothetical protein